MDQIIFFRRFSGHNLRYALFVYRLIGAMLIGNFSDDPFLKIKLKFWSNVLYEYLGRWATEG